MLYLNLPVEFWTFSKDRVSSLQTMSSGVMGQCDGAI